MRSRRSSMVQAGVSQRPESDPSRGRGTTREMSLALVFMVILASRRGSVPRRQLAFTDGAELAQLGAPPNLAGFLVVLARPQFSLETTSLQQPFETAQGGADRF